mmetsp:Transcript_68949/g.191987  ORF Transcript_68949/g.191987 Transcript_68949/m.191987 type:complete len:298 (+) Transcript_68949:734-1627(+)
MGCRAATRHSQPLRLRRILLQARLPASLVLVLKINEAAIGCAPRRSRWRRPPKGPTKASEAILRAWRERLFRALSHRWQPQASRRAVCVRPQRCSTHQVRRPRGWLDRHATMGHRSTAPRQGHAWCRHRSSAGGQEISFQAEAPRRRPCSLWLRRPQRQRNRSGRLRHCHCISLSLLRLSVARQGARRRHVARQDPRPQPRAPLEGTIRNCILSQILEVPAPSCQCSRPQLPSSSTSRRSSSTGCSNCWTKEHTLPLECPTKTGLSPSWSPRSGTVSSSASRPWKRRSSTVRDWSRS